jgi:FkbM family methyltransferase
MRITLLPFYKKLARYGVSRMFSGNAENSTPTENGESWLINEIVSEASHTHAPIVFFDIGANRGDYTALITKACQASHASYSVHAFEPMPHSASKFRAQFPDVELTEAALSDQSGETDIYSPDDNSTFASLHARKEIGPTEHHTIRTARGDAYCREKNISSIQLLKIDTEGHELHVLQGFGDFLRADTIDCVQFEYGGATLDAHSTLREIYALLHSRGFVVGRLMQSHIEIQNYHPFLEDFVHRNYVALGTRFQK